KAEKIRKIQPSKIDLVVVPGVAFDIRRNRIGYGGGYYDRFLKKTSFACFKVGLAFEAQIADEVPIDRYDVPLHMVITENAII
ncbi:MAG: 5-formyltetrahydrofolate cyclo-ligase, partial [Bacillota bacterium]|nr:5-formyltetrahydrofolate cyclo-ligase [Bacillota bacterium]